MTLQVDRLSIEIKNKTLVQDVSLRVEPGQVLTLLGPNGAGKSSLLKAMTGEYRASAGQVVLNGRPYAQWPSRDLARLVGVLPQQSMLSFPFRVIDVVMLGRLPHETGRVKDGEIARAALEQVDMLHMAASLYPSLSGGEKQRVQLARVLTQIRDDVGLGERFLLLDEPTSALDLAHQHQIMAVARTLAEQGVGVLAILHDFNLAAQYADYMVLLEKGQVAASGSVDQVLEPALMSRVFGIGIDVVAHPRSDRPLVITC